METASSWWDRRTLAAIFAIATLFCAFFWFGFYVGKTSRNSAAPAVLAHPRKENPVSERLVWRIGLHGHAAGQILR